MTGCTVVPGGAGRVTLAATRSTSAPRSTAARARAQPIRPEERLPRNRTGSRCSRVPPALTTTRRPARSRAAARCTIEGSVSTAVATAASSAGSGRRPGPVSGPVSRPESGSTTMQPRDRSVSTLARVAACSHISVCIAGAKTTGQWAVSRVEVSRSSARPVAARASRSAVAGATITRSACWPSRTCGTWCTSSKTDVCTGLPDRAAQVAAPTNSSAAAVGITVTS